MLYVLWKHSWFLHLSFGSTWSGHCTKIFADLGICISAWEVGKLLENTGGLFSEYPLHAKKKKNPHHHNKASLSLSQLSPQSVLEYLLVPGKGPPKTSGSVLSKKAPGLGGAKDPRPPAQCSGSTIERTWSQAQHCVRLLSAHFLLCFLDETVNLHNGVSNRRDALRSGFKDIW